MRCGGEWGGLRRVVLVAVGVLACAPAGVGCGSSTVHSTASSSTATTSASVPTAGAATAPVTTAPTVAAAQPRKGTGARPGQPVGASPQTASVPLREPGVSATGQRPTCSYDDPGESPEQLAKRDPSAPAPLHRSQKDTAKGVYPVAGQYIVALKSGSCACDVQRIERLATSDGASILARLHDRFGNENGFGAKDMSDAEVAAVRADPSVAYVNQDEYYAHLNDGTTQGSAPWGLDRIDQRSLPVDHTYTYHSTGTGVKTYVIDSGIRLTHQDFGGHAVFGTNTSHDGRSDDCYGHGTAVASVIGGATRGVAKQATLVAVRIEDCDGGGTAALEVAHGIDYVTGDHQFGQPAVANMSFGVPAATPDGVLAITPSPGWSSMA